MRSRRGWALFEPVAFLSLVGCTAAIEPPPESASPEETATVAPAPAAGADCLVGDWRAGVEVLQPAYDSIPVGLEYPRAVLAADSSIDISFDAADGFALTQHVPAALEWEGYPAAVVLGGAMSGEYAAGDDGSLALTATENTLDVTAGDDEPASELFAVATQETLTEWPVSASAFSCIGDALTLSLSTEGFPAEVAFTRR